MYYCSGHGASCVDVREYRADGELTPGYGHATRVSAFARHLLSLQHRPTVYIVSSAPKHVFADSIAQGGTSCNAASLSCLPPFPLVSGECTVAIRAAIPHRFEEAIREVSCGCRARDAHRAISAHGGQGAAIGCRKWPVNLPFSGTICWCFAAAGNVVYAPTVFYV